VNCLLIYNPRLAHTEDKAREMAAQIRRQGAVATIRSSEQPALAEGTLDAIIGLGGDGTIIRIATLYAEGGIPVLGVNMGTIGFLSNLEADETAEYLPRLLRGEYTLDQRMMLTAEVCEKGVVTQRYLALNEFCVKTPGAHMVRLGISIGGNFHSWYKGDGLLVSTPTGSTAYALSAGGPVIDPTLEVILLTPLLSYLLAKRPLVIAGDKEICLEGAEEIFLSCDGRASQMLAPDFTLRLRRAEVRFPLINLKGRDFFAGVDKRLGSVGHELI
jgi:NAD+ kinase